MLSLLEGQAEEQRKLLQNLSVIAWQTARLTAGLLVGERQQPVYEQFPFWTEAEQNTLRLARYRSMMEGLAAAKGKKVHL